MGVTVNVGVMVGDSVSVGVRVMVGVNVVVGVIVGVGELTSVGVSVAVAVAVAVFVGVWVVVGVNVGVAPGGGPAGGATTVPAMATDPRIVRELVDTISNGCMGMSGTSNVNGDVMVTLIRLPVPMESHWLVERLLHGPNSVVPGPWSYIMLIFACVKLAKNRKFKAA